MVCLDHCCNYFGIKFTFSCAGLGDYEWSSYYKTAEEKKEGKHSLIG